MMAQTWVPPPVSALPFSVRASAAAAGSEVVAIRFFWQSSGTAGTRRIYITIDDEAGNEKYMILSPYTQIATELVTYTLAPVMTPANANQLVNFALPQKLILAQGDLITIADIAGIDVVNDLPNGLNITLITDYG